MILPFRDVIESTRERLEVLPAGGNLIEAVMLYVVDQHLALGKHIEWFGCTHHDWWEIARITEHHYRYSKGVLNRFKLCWFERTHRLGSGTPIVYHSTIPHPNPIEQGGNTVEWQGVGA